MHSKTDHGALLCFALIFLLGTCFTFPNLGGAGLSLPSNNAVWLAAILFISITAANVYNREAWVLPDNALIHLLLVLAMILPLLWNPDTTNQGLLRMTAVVMGIIFFLSLFSSFTVDNEKKLLMIILASGLIQAIWGTVQIFLFDTNFPEGIFQQRNVFASFLATTLMVSLMFLKKTEHADEKYSRIIAPGILFFSFLVGIVIATINSRAAYLAILIGLMFMYKSNILVSRYLWLAVIMLFLGGFVGSMNTEFTNIEALSRRIANSTDASTGRLLIWKISLEILKENWLPGIGYGNFEQYFFENNARFFLTHGEYFPLSTDHPHNEFVLWCIEGGLLPSLALLLYTGYNLYRIEINGKSIFPYVAMLTPLVLHSLLEYPFYHSILHFFLFLTILFLFELHAGTVTELKFKQKKHYKKLITLLFCIASVFFITNLHASFIIKEYYEIDVKSRKLDSLVKIINPVSVQVHIDYAILNTLLNGVKKTRDLELMQQFVEHVNHMLDNHPRAEFYVALLDGYSVFNDSDNYARIKETAHYYYPTNVRFMDAQSNKILK